MQLKNIYTSVACNRTSNSVDWGENGLIAFAACNAVVLMDPKFHGSCKIIRTLVQHTKRINSIKWIKSSSSSNQNEYELISGSDDGTAIIWNVKNSNEIKFQTLIGHESGVNIVDALYINDDLLVATASTDSTIKLWNFNSKSQTFECFQTILLKSGFCFVIKIVILPLTKQTLLIYAGDDDNIYLLTEFKQKNTNDHVEKQFIKIHELIGHSDWVRSIDCIQINNNELLLASGSQDTFIRLWKISTKTEENETIKTTNFLNGVKTNCDGNDGDDEEENIQMEETQIEIKLFENDDIYKFSVNLESVLQGHEGWIYGVHWSKNNNHLHLLSSSIDKTLIIWSPNEDGIWMEKVRLGDVGGNSLGFFGGKFRNDGKSLIGHGYQGSFHIWSQSENDDTVWEPQVIVGGHFNDVRDLTWEPYGQFLLTVSADQTTRIHAPWIRSSKMKCSDDDITWHEIARPQVHGYDMWCIAALSRYRFASGADEKIIRTFQATANFIENFRRICDIKSDLEGDQILQSLPKGASVPSLGLSNKAVYNVDEETPSHEKHVKDEYPENYFVPTTLNSPPQEETLMQNTLWPEEQKLYGHGFPIITLCASLDGKYLASACIATTSEHAQIIIWDTSTWKQIQKLQSHHLTVKQMKFSPNNQYLLSVSRDRRWSLFENKSMNEKNENSSSIFQLIATTDKNNRIHGRIIWSCDWSHDSLLFGTTSRDGKAVLWHKTNYGETSSTNWELLSCLELKNESITAIAFAPFLICNNENNNVYLIALGLENGKILLYKFCNKIWKEFFILDKQVGHHLSVQKLQFKPCDNELLLASCGEDNFVRIYEIKI